MKISGRVKVFILAAAFISLGLLQQVLPNLFILTKYPGEKIYVDAKPVHLLRSAKVRPRSGELPTGKWDYQTSKEQTLTIRSLLYSVPTKLVPYLDAPSKGTTIIAVHRACRDNPINYALDGIISCVYPIKNQTRVLELDTQVVDTDPSSRFVVLHELGHVIDLYYYDGKASDFWISRFEKSSKWKKCIKASDNNNCIAPQELFAEQFAYYVTGDTRSWTGYNAPKLLSNKEFERYLFEDFKEFSLDN